MAAIAVTGDIGAGKSLAARLLAAKLECECLDADELAKDLWTREDVKAQAVSRWGSEILDTSGRIIPSRISERIFSAKSEHDFCSRLIHPLVMAELRERIRNLKDSVLEIPLLAEAGRPEWIGRAVYVTAEFSVRAERRQAQRGWSVDELRKRESFLLPQPQRMAACEIIISNDGSINDLEQKLEEIIYDYKRSTR